MSYPYTSLQNGKAEHIFRTINNMLRSVPFKASILARYWVEGFHTAIYLLNHLPTKAISMTSLYFTLHGVTPSYKHLRVFGCACYPNLSAIAAHKLAHWSNRYIFLGYSTDHKGYRCLDLTTNNIVVSRHVFDETDLPFSVSLRLTNDLDIFCRMTLLMRLPCSLLCWRPVFHRAFHRWPRLAVRPLVRAVRPRLQ
jgi:hypothetical protein